MAHEEGSYAAFFALLMAAIHSLIKVRWKSLRHLHKDLENDCVTTLFEWREAGLLRADETTAELASRLVKESGRSVKRDEMKDERLVAATKTIAPDPPTNPEADVIGDDLRQRVWDLQSTLEPKHQRVLEAYAQAETEDRSIAEILGVSSEAGRKMAERARAALYAAIKKAGLTASDFLDTTEVSDA